MQLYLKSLAMASAIMLGIMGIYRLVAGELFQEGVVLEVMAAPGDRGEEVAMIQEKLVALGHYHGEISGIYDVMTAEAVKQFQTEKGIDVSGNCNPETRYLLGLSVDTEELILYERRRFIASTIDAVCPEAPYLVRVALGGVILRRCEEVGFPDDATSVVFCDDSMAAALTHDYAKEPSSLSWAAVRDAENGMSPCPEAMYYKQVAEKPSYDPEYTVVYKNGKHIFLSEKAS